jgi:hypothetical protein
MRDLSTLVPADSSLTFFDATDINSRGEIVGLGFQKSTSEAHGFLLTPSNDEVVGENASPAGSDNIRSKVVLSENIRKMLQQLLGHRYHIPGLWTPKD